MCFLVISLSGLQKLFAGLLKGHSKLFLECWHLFVLFSIKMIPYCFSNVEVWDLERPVHD